MSNEYLRLSGPLRFLPALWLAAVPILLPACGPTSPKQDRPSAGQPLLDMTRARIIDLTHPYDDETLYWPTSPSRFELTELSYGPTEAGYFYSAYSLCTPEHGGTHIDAPIHFAEGGRTVGQIPLPQVIAPGVLIDVTDAAARDRDYRLTPEALRAWEAEHGEIPGGAIVLLRTGWSRFWPDAKEYLGDDTPGDASRLHFPSYGEEAARFLVEERRAAVLGVDTASIDYGPSRDFTVHQIASGANVPALENVANLDELPPVGSWIIALPIKTARGSGGPVRIVALLPE
ncbi:MAG: cyclase family protein [Acidobacteriota bacterium]